MAKRVMNKELDAKLNLVLEQIKKNDIENKKTKGITLIALGFAVFAVSLPLVFEINQTGDDTKILVIIVYSLVTLYIFYKAFTIKINSK